jgi:hypothetical protein
VVAVLALVREALGFSVEQDGLEPQSVRCDSERLKLGPDHPGQNHAVSDDSKATTQLHMM